MASSRSLEYRIFFGWVNEKEIKYDIVNYRKNVKYASKFYVLLKINN